MRYRAIEAVPVGSHLEDVEAHGGEEGEELLHLDFAGRDDVLLRLLDLGFALDFSGGGRKGGREGRRGVA